MASINGVQIHHIHQFKGHDGMTCYGGFVSFKGETLGLWLQDKWGAPYDQFGFDRKILDNAVKDFKAGFPDGYIYKDITCTETLLSALVVLNNIQEDVEEYLDYDNCHSVIFVGNNTGYSHIITTPLDNDEEIDKNSSRHIKKIEDELDKTAAKFSNPYGRKRTFHYIFKSPEDFDLTINENYPAPDILVT